MPTVADIADALERFAPPSLAAQWDNVGLLLGRRDGPADRLLTCLTITPPVADEAVAAGVNLIVTHHPVFFRGNKRLTDETSEGRAVLMLAQNGVAVYSPHTAFDNCPGGINDRLAARIGLTLVRPLRAIAPAGSYKLVVFVPESDLAKVSDAVFAAGAGVIGDYRECSFRLAGTGTFFGGQSANPAVGQRGRREEVNEWRLEVVCPKPVAAQVIAAMRVAHSYEEPAFDLYPISCIGASSGEGRIGVLPVERSITTFAGELKTALSCGPLQVVGDPERTLKTVAVACGAAGEFLEDALHAGADVFVTGEMRFHDYLRAQSAGIALLLPGHYATERFAVEELAGWISTHVPGVTATASTAERDPVGWH